MTTFWTYSICVNLYETNSIFSRQFKPSICVHFRICVEILNLATCATAPEGLQKGRRITIQPDFVLVRNEVIFGWYHVSSFCISLLDEGDARLNKLVSGFLVDKGSKFDIILPHKCDFKVVSCWIMIGSTMKPTDLINILLTKATADIELLVFVLHSAWSKENTILWWP